MKIKTYRRLKPHYSTVGRDRVAKIMSPLTYDLVVIIGGVSHTFANLTSKAGALAASQH